MELTEILLKVNVSLLICYLVYRSVLRQLTFYNLNRAYLLAAIIISALVPLIPYSRKAKAGLEAWSSATGIEALSFRYYFAEGEQPPFSPILSTVYWAGVWVMAGVLLLQLFSLFALYLRSRKASALGKSIRTVNEPIGPFSFFKTIFINPGEHSLENLTSILQHEEVHVRQWHSLDVLLGELKRTFCWFNPAAWLILKAIRENLEFVADRKVLQNVMDRKVYQYALLASHQRDRNGRLTNNFNLSHLKIRITMMNKTRSSERHLFKYLLVVPVIATIPLLMATTSVSIPGEVIRTKNSTTASIRSTPDEDGHVNGPDTEDGSGKGITLSDHKGAATKVYNKVIHQETIVNTDFEVTENTSGPAQTLVVDHPGTQLPAVHFTIEKENRIGAEVYETQVSSTPLKGSGEHNGTGRTITASIKLKDDQEGSVKKARSIAQDAKFYHLYVDGVKQDERSAITFKDKKIYIKYLEGQDAKDHDDAVKDGEGVMLVETK